MTTTAASATLKTLLLEGLPEILRAIEADLRRERLSTPTTVGQFRALRAIADGAATTSEVARRLLQTLPTASRQVDTLVVRGLVDRTQSVADRRSVELALTPAGLALLEEFADSAGARVEHLLMHLGRDDRNSLETALTSLLTAARQHAGTPREVPV